MLIKRIVITVTNKCNNNCRFCYFFDDFKDTQCGTDTIKKNIRDFSKEYTHLVLTGGEMTLNKDLPGIIGYAKKLGYTKIGIITNGRLFSYKNFAKRIMLAGVDEFTVSLHGHNENVHDYLTRTAGSFKQTVVGIKNLKELGCRVITYSVLAKPNYKHAQDITRLVEGLGIEESQLSFPFPMGRAIPNIKDIVPKMTDVLPYLKKAIDYGKKKGIKVHSVIFPYCILGGYAKYDAELKTPPGKSLRGKKIFSSFTEIAKFIKLEACKKCIYNSLCNGVSEEYIKVYGSGEFKTQKKSFLKK